MPKDRIIDVGPFNIIADDRMPAPELQRALGNLGLQLEMLVGVARALDALDCAGVHITDEHYEMALLAAMLSDDEPCRAEAFERSQRRLFIEGLQRLREQGIDIPLQAWELDHETS